MAAGGSRFDDPSYKNWLRSTLALMFMKEGLEVFSEAQSKLFHERLLNSCGRGTSRCTSGCTYEKLIRDVRSKRWYMICTFCDDWLTEVINYHSDFPFPKLSPENTDPQKWRTCHWETSKLFLPYGCRADNCAKDSDTQGILSLFINNQYFFTIGHISRADLLHELVKIRNVLFHSGNFQVNNTDVNDHLQKILDFLQGMTGLTGSQRQSIREAVDKIQELQASRLDLSLNKELELRALQQRQLGLEREMKSLESTVESLKKEQDNQESKLNSTDSEIKHHEGAINELKETKDRFEEFLEANDLKDDMARMSTQIQNVETQLSTQIQNVETELSTQIQNVETELSTQRQQVKTQFKTLGSKVNILEEQMKTKADIPVASSSETWEKRCKDLQQVLMDHYKTTCLVVQNPAENNDIGLEYLCVDPTIRVVRQSKGRDGLKNVKEDATRFLCRNIFFNEEYRSRQIYITGEAGSGKSMMCKTLVRLWCEAHGVFLSNESEDSESDSEDEIFPMFPWNTREQRRQARGQRHEERKARRKENRQLLSHFTLLFYITLRDSLSEYSVSEMIESQILKYHVSVKGLSVSDFLSNESCLIIADGLDEWVCPTGAPVPHFLNPGIPGRDIFNKTNVFLTTTRPWKLDILQLKSSEVDKHVELCALSEQSASQICSKVVKLLNKSQSCKKTNSEFFWTLQQKGLGHFKTIPVLLIQLICLWFDNQELGKSQVQLYCAMLDLLLKKSEKNLCVQTSNTPTSVSSETPLPTNTPTSVASETPLPTNTPTSVASETPLPTSTPTSVASETPLPTNTPTSVASETPLPTNTPTSVASETPLPTNTQTSVASETPLPTNTPTSVASETPLPTNTPTSVASETPLPTNTPTSVASETPLPTNTPTSVASETPLPTNTPTSVASETPLPTNTPASVASETPLPTNTPTSVASETPLPTNTQTSVASETPLPTNTPTSVASETPLPINTPASVASETPLPECILINPHCLIHQQLIYSLSRVAYEALFDKTKENSLVFKSSQLEIYGVGQESIDMCLKSGILSQNKVLEKCSVSEKKMSFLHKKFQEFLAAIFLASCDNVQGVVKHITDFCSTSDTCLEMSQVWLFVSGIRPDITRQLLEHLTRVVSADTKVKHYRQTLDDYNGQDLIRVIQTCVADCVIECDNNGHSYDGFMLEDFYIDSDNTACHVERLLSCTPRSKVKSVYINTIDIGESQLTSITGQLEDCKSVQKLYLDDWSSSRIDISTVTQIVNNNLDTLTCLHLDSYITGTDELVSDICSISSECLMALSLSVSLTHEHIEQILTRLPHSPTIRQLHLVLDCTDHGRQCRPRIDLSTMTHIHTLVLYDMSVDNLQSVSDSVEYVTLVNVILPVTTLCEFVLGLVQTRRHVQVELLGVTVSEVRESRVDVETFLRTCHGLKVIDCQYRDSNNTWYILFSTSSQ